MLFVSYHYYLFFLALVTLVTAQDCFFPNGTDRNFLAPDQPLYKSCQKTRGGGKASMCCRIAGGGVDNCRDDGLCWNSGNNQLWRESCTDPTWKDPSCVKLYTIGLGPGILASSTDVQLRQCDDGSFCPGADNTTCCANHQGFALRDGLAVPVSSLSNKPTTTSTTGSISASSTATPVTTTSAPQSSKVPTGAAVAASTSPSSMASQPSGAGNDTAVIVGGILGGLGILALIAGMFLLYRYRKRKQQVQRGDERPDSFAQEKFMRMDSAASTMEPSPKPRPLTKVHEMTGTVPIYEMSNYDGPKELPVH